MAWPKVWPKFRMARKLCSRSSLATTVALISQDLRDRIGQRVHIARQQLGEVVVQPVEQQRVPHAAVLDHFGKSGAQFPVRQGGERVGVRNHPAAADRTRRSGSCRRDDSRRSCRPPRSRLGRAASSESAHSRSRAGNRPPRIPRCRRPRRPPAPAPPHPGSSSWRPAHRTPRRRFAASCAARRPARCIRRSACRQGRRSIFPGTGARRCHWSRSTGRGRGSGRPAVRDGSTIPGRSRSDSVNARRPPEAFARGDYTNLYEACARRSSW